MKKMLLLMGCLLAFYAQAAVVPVPESGSISDAITGASPGDIIELSSGTYVGNVTIDKSLTLQAAAGLETPPVIQGRVSVQEGETTISGIVFDGNNEVADAIRVDNSTNGKSVEIVGCTIRNYTNRFLYLSLSGKIESRVVGYFIFLLWGRS